MATDARKHQKRMERRHKRAKQKRKDYVKSRVASPFALLRRAGTAPFLPCSINGSVFQSGIGNLSVARLLPDGRVAAVVFLVDVFCLGVKNLMYRLHDRAEYENVVLPRIMRDQVSRTLTPEEAKKLVVGSVAYAAEFGIAPHEDYARAKVIFEGVDSSQCTTEFTYGKDGLPYYISGPHDNAAFRKRILALLEKNAGHGNFHYLMEVSSSEVEEMGGWTEDEEQDEIVEGGEGGDSEPPIEVEYTIKPRNGA